jgi:DNA-binding NarL/FixJ family response regulator
VSHRFGATCVGTFVSAEGFLKSGVLSACDVVLMDIDLPGRSGIETTAAIRRLRPELQVVMLTVFEDSDKIFAALKAGATGYLTKKSSNEELLEALRQVMRGESPMSGHIARKVVASFHPEPKSADGLDGLTPTERAVLERLARGFLYKEIAAELALSIDTVRTHIRSIYLKLQVHSRTEAAVRFIRHRG